MERSLTVLIPVHDAQSTLTNTVQEVLDAASDITDRFELLIIDDGSTDATAEVADELRRHYPQVRMLRHSRPLGRQAAVETGLAESRGEVVLVRGLQDGSLERVHRRSRPGRPSYLGKPKRSVLTR